MVLRRPIKPITDLNTSMSNTERQFWRMPAIRSVPITVSVKGLSIGPMWLVMAFTYRSMNSVFDISRNRPPGPGSPTGRQKTFRRFWWLMYQSGYNQIHLSRACRNLRFGNGTGAGRAGCAAPVTIMRAIGGINGIICFPRKRFPPSQNCPQLTF